MNVEIQSGSVLRFFGGWQRIDKVIFEDKVIGEIITRRINGNEEVTTHAANHSVSGQDVDFLLKEMGVK